MENENQTKWGMCERHNGIMRAFGIVLVIYVAVLAYSTLAKAMYIGRDVQAVTTINVSADSEVYSAPDLAVMDFSVESQAKTVADATKDNTAKMNAINAAVKGFGIEAKDLKTTNYNIYPRYDYVRQVVPVPQTPSVTPSSEPADTSSIYYPDGKQVLAGYVVNQTLTVKMRDLAKVGQIIEAVTQAGANQVGSLQFTIDQQDSLKAQARQQAIDEAKEKAKVLAKQLGVRLVRIVNFSESNYQPVYYEAKAMDSAATGIGGGAPAPSIEAGQNKITANVSITYEIQ